MLSLPGRDIQLIMNLEAILHALKEKEQFLIQINLFGYNAQWTCEYQYVSSESGQKCNLCEVTPL